MKKKISVTIAILAVVLSSVMLSIDTYSNPNGAPSRASGAPNDDPNGCSKSGCHNGTPTARAGLLTSDIPVDGYIPGQTYTFTVQITQAGISKWGFQVTPQTSAGTLLGTFILTNTGQTRFSSGSNGSKYVTHTSAGNSGSSGSKTWTFDWTAPSVGTGAVNFYTYAMAANGNGNESGDQVFKETVTYQELTGVGFNQSLNAAVEVFPNPVNNGYFVIKGLTPGLNKVKIFDFNGKVVLSETISQELQNVSTTGFASGVYYVAIEGVQGRIVKKLVIQ